MKKHAILILSALIWLVGYSAVSSVHAATIAINMQLPTTRADQTPFDPLTETQRIEIGCGLSSVGPFDVLTVESSGPFDNAEYTLQVSTPEDSGYHCVAFLVDTAGRISGPSNIAEYVYTAPPSSLNILDMDDVVVTGTINFSFTVDQTGVQ